MTGVLNGWARSMSAIPMMLSTLAEPWSRKEHDSCQSSGMDRGVQPKSELASSKVSDVRLPNSCLKVSASSPNIFLENIASIQAWEDPVLLSSESLNASSNAILTRLRSNESRSG